MPDLRIPNLESCLRTLRQTVPTLRGLLSSATPDQLQWRASQERWSIAMILAHLAEVEAKGFQDRFRALLAEDQAVLPAYDQMALFHDGRAFDARAELDRFAERRGQTLALLDGLPEHAGERTARHEQLGVLTLAQLLNEFAFHDLGHIRQVIEIYRSCVFFPEMGVYRGYYQIHP